MNLHPRDPHSSRPGAALHVGAALLAGLLAVPGAALVYIVPTDESMVDRTPVIVFGEVQHSRPGPAQGPVSTDFVLDVEEVLKGFVPGSRILVRQPGGVGPDGVTSAIAGLPTLLPGDRVLLFLAPAGDAYRTVEYALGMFFETPAGKTNVLVREAAIQEDLPATAGADEVAHDAGRVLREASAFRRWIADRAANVERVPDYLKDFDVGGPASVAEPFRLLVPRQVYGCGGGTDGVAFRWREFDDAHRLDFFVHGSQRGLLPVPGGVQPGVGAAMTTWNADPRSQVSLVGTASMFGAPRARERDGQNSITFEDPHDEIDGEFRREGTLAVAHVFCDPAADSHEWTANSDLLNPQALPIIEANIVTQDGFHRLLESSGANADINFQEVIAHELGHAIGIGHSCNGDEESWVPPCKDATLRDEALMSASHHGDGRGPRLGADDQEAVRFLYPHCDSATATLHMEGGYNVCASFLPPVSEGRRDAGGIWADAGVTWADAGVTGSSNSGLLWFFSSDNPEILVKVLNGCNQNGHMWVFVAPSTDQAFSLWVAGPGGSRPWYHRNELGTSTTGVDFQAFPCP